MADLEGNINAKNFQVDTPAPDFGFRIKGAGNHDYGIKRRLGRIFGEDGRTVMLAFDHGYFQGPTRGLERIDLNIVPLAQHADALMGTRGIFRSSFPAELSTPLVVRASGGPSILKELSDENVAMSIKDAARMDAAAVAVQVFIGGEHETRSIKNMTDLVDGGLELGIPVLGVTAVGKDMVRDARYIGLATRIIAVGMTITAERLAQIAAMEQVIAEAGFLGCRARLVNEGTVCLQLAEKDMEQQSALATLRKLRNLLGSVGAKKIFLDLDGR